MNAGKAMLAAIFAGTAGMVVATDVAAEQSMARQTSPNTLQLRAEGDFPPLDGATERLHTRPLTKAELRGKVVPIDFWTYSCIN
jgi:hypothetical protein